MTFSICLCSNCSSGFCRKDIYPLVQVSTQSSFHSLKYCLKLFYTIVYRSVLDQNEENAILWKTGWHHDYNQKGSKTVTISFWVYNIQKCNFFHRSRPIKNSFLCTSLSSSHLLLLSLLLSFSPFHPPFLQPPLKTHTLYSFLLNRH